MDEYNMRGDDDDECGMNVYDMIMFAAEHDEYQFGRLAEELIKRNGVKWVLNVIADAIGENNV